jgi:uncharacterized membrane protein YhhN
MLIPLLIVLATITASVTISAEYRGPRRVHYLFKPLTLVLITILALIPKYPVSPFYQYMIVVGLLCSLAGDVFLMLPSDRFIHGLASFLIAHAFYTAAFLVEGNRPFSMWAALPLVVYGGFMLWLLWGGLGKMKAPVIFYVSALLLMALIASSRYVVTKQPGSLLAAVGVILFVASDSVLALDKFKSSFRLAQFLILTTYFVAQCLIALST